jgi:uncharacterized protein YbjT (DUF2867 family)
MIAVSGATGTIGRELVRLLAEAGEQVRALTREPPRDGGAAGVEWVSADLADRATLAPAFADATTLFLLTSNSDDMVRLQKNAIRAAAQAGVRTIVKLSALGATDHSRSLIGLWHYNVERELRDSGIAWTILRPHHFMQNFLDPIVLDRSTGIVRSSAGDGAIPFIDTRDIAAVAARVLTEPERHEREIYTLTGAEALSYAQATEIIGRTIGGIGGRALSFVPETTDEAWNRRRAAGQPPWMVAAQLAIAEYQRAGGATARTTDTVERLTGRPPRTLADFARDHAAELRGRDDSGSRR